MSEVWPGRPFPLGATWDGGGTNFSLFSEHAEGVELCLFDDDGDEQRDRGDASAARTTGTAICPGSGPASATATACTVPTSPPTATASTRQAADRPVREGDRGRRRLGADANVLPYVPNGGDATTTSSPTTRTTPRAIPKSVVVDGELRLGGRPPPRIPFADTVIYETHVKGFTMRHPEVREDLRGTYAGLASEPALAYLQASSGSRPSSCCRSTTSPTSRSCSSAGCATTGATARSATSRPTPSTPPPAAAASRCASSRGWSRRCTGPGSR